MASLNHPAATVVPGVLTVLLYLMTASPSAEARTCAYLYNDVSQCGGTDFTLAQSGVHVTDMMTFNNIVSEVLVEAGCVLTVYTEEGYGGACISIEGFSCKEMSEYGQPSSCDGHHPPGSFAAAGVHPMISGSSSSRHARDTRRIETQWDNAPSSFKCDCTDE